MLVDDASGLCCEASTWEEEVRLSEAQGHPQLHSEFKAKLGYMRPYIKPNNNNSKQISTQPYCNWELAPPSCPKCRIKPGLHCPTLLYFPSL